MCEIDWLCINELRLRNVIQHLSDEEFAQEYNAFIRSYEFVSSFFTSYSMISNYLDYMHDIFSEEVGRRFLCSYGLSVSSAG